MDSSAGGWETMQLGGLCPDRDCELGCVTNSDPEGKGLPGVVPKACLPSEMFFMLQNWHLFRKTGPHSFV